MAAKGISLLLALAWLPYYGLHCGECPLSAALVHCASVASPEAEETATGQHHHHEGVAIPAVGDRWKSADAIGSAAGGCCNDAGPSVSVSTSMQLQVVVVPVFGSIILLADSHAANGTADRGVGESRNHSPPLYLAFRSLQI